MRIIVLGTRGFPNVQGGVEAHCQNLYPHLVKLGCEVIVFTRRSYVDINLKEYKMVKLVALPSIKNKFLETVFHTCLGVFAALKYKPDILHIHAIGPSLFTPIARILGMKVVITSHGINYKHIKWGWFAKLILRLGEFLGVIYANGIIAISKNIADDIKKKYNRDVTVIPNGVTIQKIIQTEDILKKYHLEKGKYLLAVGRLVPEKCFHDLIDAFNLFQLENRDSQSKIPNPKSQIPNDTWKLVIVGRADHEDSYSLNLKKKSNENSNIILTGFLSGEPLDELYSHARLFALPSCYEGLPIVLLEAMSYGLSCIASDIQGNKNIGLPENRYFKTGDVEALAAKIEEFINKPINEDERKEQIIMLTKRYNWERISERTLEVYNKVL